MGHHERIGELADLVVRRRHDDYYPLGHAELVRRNVSMEYIVKRTADEQLAKVAGKWVASTADVQRFPALVEFLGATMWDDGSTRILGTILLFCEDGRLKCCLNDKDGGVVGFCTLPALAVAMDQVELGLCENTVEWRRRREEAGKSKR